MAKQKKSELSTANWIVKSNILNEIRYTKMDMSQSRLFAIYLSKINPQNINSREVTFKLDEYAKIMQFKRFNITQLKKSAVDLTKLVIQYEKEDKDGGFLITSSILFEYLKFYKNDKDEWLISINCDDKVLHLMFDLKKYFFKYQLWNVLQLSGPNLQRMYELLKQYENAGAREITVKDLREFLGLNPKEYPRWDNFKTRILDASQTALSQHTDIKFTWEVAGKGGKGGKINALKFSIEKNEDYIKQLTLDEFLSEQKSPAIDGEPEEFEQSAEDDILSFMADACNKEFKFLEIQVLYNMIVKIVPQNGNKNRQLEMYDYLKSKYDQLNLQASRTTIKRRFGYIKKIIESDLKEIDD